MRHELRGEGGAGEGNQLSCRAHLVTAVLDLVKLNADLAPERRQEVLRLAARGHRFVL